MLSAHTLFLVFICKGLLYIRDETLFVILTAHFPRVYSAVTSGFVSSQGSRSERLRLLLVMGALGITCKRTPAKLSTPN